MHRFACGALAVLVASLALVACDGGSTSDIGDGDSTPDATADYEAGVATALATFGITPPSGTLPPEGTFTPGPPRPPEEAARQDLALRLEADPDDIEVVSVTAQDWPDACLGVGGPDEVCAQVITPGFEVTLRVGESEFVYRTNQDGTIVRFATVRIGDEDE